MKILIYGINFPPELTGIGKYTGEMAAWLAGRGHQVRVVTALPYYPEWKVGAGFSRLLKYLLPPTKSPFSMVAYPLAASKKSLIGRFTRSNFREAHHENSISAAC